MAACVEFVRFAEPDEYFQVGVMTARLGRWKFRVEHRRTRQESPLDGGTTNDGI